MHAVEAGEGAVSAGLAAEVGRGMMPEGGAWVSTRDCGVWQLDVIVFRPGCLVFGQLRGIWICM